MKKIIANQRTYFLSLAIFSFGIITLPYVINLLIPCFNPTPGQSYFSDSCTIDLAMNYYLIFSLTSLGSIVLAIFLLKYPRSLKRLGVLAVCLSLITILGFLSYIPFAEKKIKRAPITLFAPQSSP